MSWRSIALALLVGPLAAVLFVAAAVHSLDPATWPHEARLLSRCLAVILSLAIACLFEGDFNARA